MKVLWSWHGHSFHKNLICLLGVACNPCLQTLRACINPKDLVVLSLDYFLTNGNFKISIGCIWRKFSVGWLVTLQSFWLLIRALELLISNPVRHFRSLYDHNFHKDLICCQCITYNHCPEGSAGGGGVILKDIITRPLELSWTKWLSQKFDLMCLGKWWAWVEGLVSHQSLPTTKNTPELSVSNRMSPFWSFFDNSFWTKCPGLKKKYI